MIRMTWYQLYVLILIAITLGFTVGLIGASTACHTI